MSPAWFACREPQHDDLLPEQEVTHLSQGVEAAAASGQSAAMCHLARNAQEVHHQVRVCGHAWALDPAPAASVTHRGRCPYPSWGHEIENKPAVKQNCCLVAQSCLTPWTVVCQASLSMGFYRQEYWSGLPCPPPGDLPHPESLPER